MDVTSRVRRNVRSFGRMSRMNLVVMRREEEMTCAACARKICRCGGGE
jgi:hypothetical protein